MDGGLAAVGERQGPCFEDFTSFEVVVDFPWPYISRVGAGVVLDGGSNLPVVRQGKLNILEKKGGGRRRRVPSHLSGRLLALSVAAKLPVDWLPFEFAHFTVRFNKASVLWAIPSIAWFFLAELLGPHAAQAYTPRC